MVDKAVVPVVEVSAAGSAGAHLLRDGIPIDLVDHAAAEYVERCRLALAALEGEDSLLAVRLMTAKIAATTNLHVTHEDLGDVAALAHQAQLMAHRLNDEVAHAYALVAWGFTHTAPEQAEARVSAGNQVLETASRRGASELVPLGYVLVLVGLLEQGEIRSLDTELLRERAQADHAGYANVARWFRCLRSIL